LSKGERKNCIYRRRSVQGEQINIDNLFASNSNLAGMTILPTQYMQYLEFFGKFFEAGGRPFRPFAEVREYTLIDKHK